MSAKFTGTLALPPSTSDAYGSRAMRPPKPAYGPVNWRSAFNDTPSFKTSISSLPMRTTHCAGNPSSESTAITPVPCVNDCDRRVKPGVRTPKACPLTSIDIWLGRLPRTSISTWCQVSYGRPGALPEPLPPPGASA